MTIWSRAKWERAASLARWRLLSPRCSQRGHQAPQRPPWCDCHGHKRHCQNTKSALHDKHPRRSLDVRLQPSRGKTKLNPTTPDGRISIPALPRRWSGKGVCAAAVFANNGRIIHWHGSIHEREPDSKFEIKRQPPGPPHVRRSHQRAFRYGPSSCIPMFYSIS